MLVYYIEYTNVLVYYIAARAAGVSAGVGTTIIQYTNILVYYVERTNILVNYTAARAAGVGSARARRGAARHESSGSAPHTLVA